MNRHYSRRTPLAAMLVLFAAAACGDSVEPPEELLAGLNEMAVYGAVVERATLFNHSFEAQGNLGLALGSGIPLEGPIPAELLGHTLVFDEATGGWRADPTPEVGASTLRVTWHELSGPFVALPPEARGFVDLTVLEDPEVNRLAVHAARTTNGTSTRAQYTTRFGETATATSETSLFEAAGLVGDGEQTVSFETRWDEVVTVSSGDMAGSYHLSMDNPGFSYLADVAETLDEAAGRAAATFTIRVTVDGVTSRLEMELDEVTGGASVGTGTLRHDGRLIAEVGVAGGQMTFMRPGGTAYRNVDQQRLVTLMSSLLIPIAVAEQYF